MLRGRSQRPRSTDGSFQAPLDFAAGNNPRYVAVGDFNGDGHLDLAVSNHFSSSVSILLGNGTGTFQAPLTYGVGLNPSRPAVADVNGDGKLDLAVPNQSDSNIAILLGNGNGTFQAAVNYAIPGSPHWVVVSDFNADGKPDLAATTFQNDNIAILLGNGNGTFQGAANYAVGASPYSAAVGDFNGDGRPDLVVTNEGTSSVSVLLNTITSFPPPTITLHPIGQIVPLAQAAVLSVNADGHGNTVAYQWRKNGTPLVDGGNISGAASPSLTVSPTGSGDTAWYDVRVSGPACGGGLLVATSSAAILAVTDPCVDRPMITQQPHSVSVLPGATATFTVPTTSGLPLTYQWRKNGVSLPNAPTGTGSVITGVTTQTLTISNVGLSDYGAAFDCVITNSCGSTRTDPAGLGDSNHCPADFNNNGHVEVQDIFSFLAAWFAGCP